LPPQRESHPTRAPASRSREGIRQEDPRIWEPRRRSLSGPDRRQPASRARHEAGETIPDQLRENATSRARSARRRTCIERRLRPRTRAAQTRPRLAARGTESEDGGLREFGTIRAGRKSSERSRDFGLANRIPSLLRSSPKPTNREPRCALRSDDTDARREALRCFGRSDRSARCRWLWLGRSRRAPRGEWCTEVG
jgi:hypothetical protein